MIQKIEYILLFSTAGVSLIIALLDVSGLLDSNTWIVQRIPAITLLCVGFVASYLVLERRGKIDAMANDIRESYALLLNEIESSSAQIMTALDGIQVTSFENDTEMFRYASKRIRQADSIDHVLWSSLFFGQPRSTEVIQAYERDYQDSVDTVLKKGSTVWREVTIFRSPKHFERDKMRVLDPANISYNLAYYDLAHIDNPPRIGFSIIDRDEVILLYAPESSVLSIRHPDIVQVFQDYFDDLWSNAEKLKQGDQVNDSRLKNIEEKVKQKL